MLPLEPYFKDKACLVLSDTSSNLFQGRTVLPNGKYAAINDPWGNVAGLFDLSIGIPVAEYEYSPFGQALRAMGIMATNNPFRFSTKYCDDETGLLNFGYRYYSSNLGRFLNRDPKDELGRLQLASAIAKSAIPMWSYVGQLIGVPGKYRELTPNTPVGLAQSNEREDADYRDSCESGNIFSHRKGNPSFGGSGDSSFAPQTTPAKWKYRH
jgi:RHS repeat-associated protein